MNNDAIFCGIHRRLFLAMIFVPAVPLILAAATGFHFFAKTTERLVTDAIRQSAVDHEIMIAGFLDERRADLESLLAMVPAKGLTGDHGQTEVEQMLHAAGNVFNDMGVIAPDGRQTSYVGPYDLKGKDYREAPWYRETLRKGYYVSDVFLGYRNVPHFVIAVARRIDKGIYVLRATVDSGTFGKIVEQVSIGDSGEAYILNKNNQLQTKRRSGGELLEDDRVDYPRQRSSVMAFTRESNGIGYLYAAAAMNDGKWRLVVRQKKDEAFRSTVLAGYAVLFILLCGGAIIIALALVVSRRVMDTLHEQAHAVGKLENQLLQAARLAELGEMSAGFAHEINNPLQIMKTDLALLDLTVRDLADQARNQEQCAELIEISDQFRIQIDRCAAITREILRFGRQETPELQPVNLTEYLPKVGTMVENKAAVHGVTLHLDVDDFIPVIKADPGQLQQVMINLLNNAIHAVVERHGPSGGDIAVTASGDSLGNAVIRVADNGCGMSEESLDKIFVPFYTTKAPGQGTGMGLPVCHSIIESMDGDIQVESRKGKGTSFTITVPGMEN